MNELCAGLSVELGGHYTPTMIQRIIETDSLQQFKLAEVKKMLKYLQTRYKNVNRYNAYQNKAGLITELATMLMLVREELESQATNPQGQRYSIGTSAPTSSTSTGSAVMARSATAPAAPTSSSSSSNIKSPSPNKKSKLDVSNQPTAQHINGNNNKSIIKSKSEGKHVNYASSSMQNAHTRRDHYYDDDDDDDYYEDDSVFDDEDFSDGGAKRQSSSSVHAHRNSTGSTSSTGSHKKSHHHHHKPSSGSKNSSAAGGGAGGQYYPQMQQWPGLTPVLAAALNTPHKYRLYMELRNAVGLRSEEIIAELGRLTPEEAGTPVTAVTASSGSTPPAPNSANFITGDEVLMRIVCRREVC